MRPRTQDSAFPRTLCTFFSQKLTEFTVKIFIAPFQIWQVLLLLFVFFVFFFFHLKKTIFLVSPKKQML